MLFDFVATFYRLVKATTQGAKRAVLANLAGIGDGLDETSGETVAQQPMYGQVGFYCRPDPPSDAGYAEIIGLKRQDGCAIVSGRDLRLNAKVNPSEGECGAVQYGGGFISLAHNADGSGSDVRGTTTVIYAPKVVSGSVEKAHAITLDTSASNLSVSIVHANGCAVLLTQQDKLVLRNKDGSQLITLDLSEIVISGVIKMFGGVVAGNPLTAQPVMLSTTLLAWIGQVQTALNTISLAAGLNPNPAIVVPASVPGSGDTAQTLKASPV